MFGNRGKINRKKNCYKSNLETTTTNSKKKNFKIYLKR